MTATTIRVQMAQRKDTAANWTAANPILLSGEIGYETDTKKFKIGDGTTNWNSLAYLPIPDGSGNLTITGNLEIGTTGTLTFEGSTADGFETTLAVTDPTADRTITFPDVSGTVVTTGDTGSVTSTMIADGTIVDADVSATAEIAVSKLANGTANQVLVTDGTDVSWSDDLTLAGNLTVNGTTTTVNTQALVVEDKNIELGVVGTPTDLTADGGGITLKGTTDKTINWVNATDSWTSSENIDLATGKSYRINGTEVLSSTTLGSGVTGSSLTSVGTLGSLTVTGSATAGTFIPTSDTAPTNGIYLPAANSVALSTNGTGRLFVDASGNVGVNNAPVSPYGLTLGPVSGQTISLLGLRSSSDTGNSRIDFGDPTASDVARIQYEHAVDSMVFRVNASERLRITSAGLVGIGTSSPAAALSVVGDAHLGVLNQGAGRTLQFHSAGGGSHEIAFGEGANNNTFSINYDGSNISPNNLLQIRASGNNLVTVTEAGRVGIGTTSPGYLLHVDAGTGLDSIRVNGKLSGSARSLTMGHNASGQAEIAAGSSAGADNTLNIFGRPTVFGLNAANEYARIDSSGRLLVGTSSSRSSQLYYPGNYASGIDANFTFQVESTSASSGIQIVSNQNGAIGSAIVLGKSRGTATGSVVAVQSGDQLGIIQFNGIDVTTSGDLDSCAASIEAVVDGTPGANDMPGRLVFSTTADGASSPTERMRITSGGVLQVADAGNIAVGTTTGTKIGTATTQKLGFYNATPVVQPAAVADATDAATVITQLNDLLAKLRTLGIIAT